MPAGNTGGSNRSPRQRARQFVMATLIERENMRRAGHFSVDDDTVNAMASMRAEGRTWDEIGDAFGLSRSGARNRVLRRVGDVAPRPVGFRCGHAREPENVAITGAFQKERCRTCHLAQKRRWRERQKEIEAGNPPKRKSGPPAAPRPAAGCLSPEALGSRALLVNMLRYGARRGGIPRLSAQDCRARLREMAA